MKMKRTLSLLLALVLSLSLLAGCGGGNSDQPPAQDNPMPASRCARAMKTPRC